MTPAPSHQAAPRRAGATKAHLLGDDPGGLLARGAVAGLVAGLAFMVATMYFADYSGKPTVAPFIAISTIFHGTAKPVMTPAALPVEVVTGVILHFALAISFGVGFAIVSRFVRNRIQLVGAGLVYGTLLWVLNFEILGRTVFPFFSNPHGPNVVFQGIIHPFIYGLFLVPFFVKLLPSRS